MQDNGSQFTDSDETGHLVSESFWSQQNITGYFAYFWRKNRTLGTNSSSGRIVGENNWIIIG